VVACRVMCFKVQTLLLQSLTLYSANKAFLRFVLHHLLPLASKRSEVVDQHTSHDIAKQ
jgi:hypothetical protein